MSVIKIFYDLETTGLDYHKAGIHQISGAVEVDGEIVREFNWKCKPFSGAKISPDALLKCNVTEEQIKAYELTEAKVHKKLKAMLSRYINQYDRKIKGFLCGYNNASFDDDFLRELFERQGDPYFGAWFWADALDVRVLAAQYLQDRRAGMPNFQLKTVAAELGIDVEAERLHDAEYDIELTREVYRIVTGLEYEL